jgi:hypothetical protein
MERSPTKLSFDFDQQIDLNRPFSSDEFKLIFQESHSVDSSIETNGAQSLSDEVAEKTLLFSQINYGNLSAIVI